MEKKKKKSWILVTVLIVILLVAATLGGYLAGASRIANDVVKQRKGSDSKMVQEKNKTISEEKSPLFYDGNKIENKKNGVTYNNEIVNGSINGVSYQIDSTNNKIVHARIYWGAVIKTHGTSINANKNQSDTDEIAIDFDKNVVEVFEAPFGQEVSSSRIVFLLEDGTAKYINEYNAVQTLNYKDLKDIKDINNIVKHYSINVAAGTTGYTTTIVQTKDGKLYDLDEFVD